MAQQDINLELMSFIETSILPRYAEFGLSHGIAHAQNVMNNSIILARTTGADVNMCYAIAAYHDLGLSGPRAIHHITGGKILRADARLKRWFSPSQINVMAEAVEDHRASASHQPRSIYGKIVAEADRELSPGRVFVRTIQYGMEHYPELDKEKQWERFCEHMRNKYSESGYIRLWIQPSPNEDNLRQLRDIIADEAKLKEAFEAALNSLTHDDKAHP